MSEKLNSGCKEYSSVHTLLAVCVDQEPSVREVTLRARHHACLSVLQLCALAYP